MRPSSRAPPLHLPQMVSAQLLRQRLDIGPVYRRRRLVAVESNDNGAAALLLMDHGAEFGGKPRATSQAERAHLKSIANPKVFIIDVERRWF